MKTWQNQQCCFKRGKGKTDYLVLGAHADSSQQPPLLFAEDAVNLPHRREVELIWWPIKVEVASLVIIHVAANHCNARDRLPSWAFLAADLSAALGFPSAPRTLFLWISGLIKRFIWMCCSILLTMPLLLGSWALSEVVIIIQNCQNCRLI